jgi:hypothetical protein
MRGHQHANQRRHHQWESKVRRRGSTSSHTYSDERSVSGNLWQSVAPHVLGREVSVGPVGHLRVLAVRDELGEPEIVAGYVEALLGARRDQALASGGDDVVHVHHVDALVAVEHAAGRRVCREAGADTCGEGDAQW